MVTLCPFLYSNEIISKHAKSIVFCVALEVLKRLREHLRTFNFWQRSEVFGNSSEIFGSPRNVSANLSQNKEKILITHLTQKKLAGIILG